MPGGCGVRARHAALSLRLAHLRGALPAGSVRQAFTIVKSLCAWLVSAQYPSVYVHAEDARRARELDRAGMY
jgi:hypothetical protein